VKSVHKALRLSQHKHTGKIIHHQHTSWGVLVLLMLIPVFMLSLVSQFVSASDSIDVSATVPQIPPMIAPTITSPGNGARFTNDTVRIAGTCPYADPALFIAIYEGTNVIGSTICDNTNHYSVSVSLSVGDHAVFAQVVTFTGNLGMASDTITITRYLPRPDASTVVPPDFSLPILPPLIIINTQPVLTYSSTGEVVWQGSFTGGTAPYTVHIDWGDGQSNDYIISDHSEHEFRHRYSNNNDIIGNSSGHMNGNSVKTSNSHPIIITVTDDNGNVTVLHITAATAVPIIIPFSSDLTTSRQWYESLLQSTVTKFYILLFIIIIIAWLLRRRHDRNERRHGPRKPLRHAHV
jgi:hypothetical protein